MNDQQQGKFVPFSRVLESYAGSQVVRLQGAYRADASWAKADLARLRKIDPLDSAGVLTTWEAIFVDPPEEILGVSDQPSRAEQALAAALHLYATHQQSKSDPMHVPRVGLGTAIRKLANPAKEENYEKPVMRRYHALTTATEAREILHHLRALVTQLRGIGQPLDYARLSSDLFRLSDERSRTNVRLAWARDLVRPSKASDDESSDTAD